MNILIVNQSITDLWTSVFLLLTTVVNVNPTGMSRHSVWDQFVCRFWFGNMPLWSTMACSTYGIVLTAFDRYVAVIYPIWYHQSIRAKKRLAYCAIAVVWIVIPAFNMSVLGTVADIISGACIPYGTISSEAVQKAISAVWLVITYLLPLTLIILSYSRIVYTLRHKVGVQGSSGVNTAAGRNAFVTSLMVCLGYIICWTPNQVYVVFIFVWHIGDTVGWLYHVTVFMMFANICINPFIYAAKYREFQQAVRRLLKRLNHVASNNT